MRVLLLLAALLTAAPALAAPALTNTQVRALVERQQRAWNARDVDGYFALYTPAAAFTDQARAPDGRMVSYGTSTLTQAKAQARRFFAKSKGTEAAVINRVVIAPDGASAQVFARETSRIETAGRIRVICADSVQTIVRTAAGRLASTGQTDTLLRCPR